MGVSDLRRCCLLGWAWALSTLSLILILTGMNTDAWYWQVPASSPSGRNTTVRVDNNTVVPENVVSVTSPLAGTSGSLVMGLWRACATRPKDIGLGNPSSFTNAFLAPGGEKSCRHHKFFPDDVELNVTDIRPYSSRVATVAVALIGEVILFSVQPLLISALWCDNTCTGANRVKLCWKVAFLSLLGGSLVAAAVVMYFLLIWVPHKSLLDQLSLRHVTGIGWSLFSTMAGLCGTGLVVCAFLVLSRIYMADGIAKYRESLKDPIPMRTAQTSHSETRNSGSQNDRDSLKGRRGSLYGSEDINGTTVR